MSRQGFTAEHWTDAAGKPFVEDVISAAGDRIHTYQLGEFACPENELALKHLRLALEALESRTRSREARGVEGTHAV